MSVQPSLAAFENGARFFATDFESTRLRVGCRYLSVPVVDALMPVVFPSRVLIPQRLLLVRHENAAVRLPVVTKDVLTLIPLPVSLRKLDLDLYPTVGRLTLLGCASDA